MREAELFEQCERKVIGLLRQMSHSFVYDNDDKLVISDSRYWAMRHALESLEDSIDDLCCVSGVTPADPFKWPCNAVADLKACLDDIAQASKTWAWFRSHENPRHILAVRLLALSIADAARNTLHRIGRDAPKRRPEEEAVLDALAICVSGANGIEDAIRALLKDASKEEPFDEFDLEFVERQLDEMRDAANAALKRYEASEETSV